MAVSDRPTDQVQRHVPHPFDAVVGVDRVSGDPPVDEGPERAILRLDPFPGLGTGLLETNGHQNYKNWKEMESYHPFVNAQWRKTVDGVFKTDDDFYNTSGGILTDSLHYQKLMGV